ncbi:MAG TPA: Calx-beta domain-containing protein [Thermoanaerobaculia bacterium]|jgi:hypothetical protein
MAVHRFRVVFALALAFPTSAATFTVTNLNDSGSGSLRAAVESANATPGADTIVFQDGLTGTIVLTGGALDVTDSLDVQGPGSGVLTIDGNDQSRIFLMASFEHGLTNAVSGLTLTDAWALEGGAAILSVLNDLTLADVKAIDNVSGGSGGGVYFSGGTLVVQDSVFSGNFAENAVSPCFEFGDVAGGRGGGLAIEDAAGVTIDNVTFTGNAARFDGGGLSVVMKMDAPATLTITGSTFSGNIAGYAPECYPASGGGAFVAGMGNDDTLVIEDSAFSGNTGGGGNAGGLLLGDLDVLTIRRSTVSGNHATNGDGGGLVLSNNATTLLENVTVAANDATGNGGALTVSGAVSTAIRHSTISGNSGTTGGIYASGSAAVTLRNSIVANGTVNDLANDGTASFDASYTAIETPGAAAITDNGGNLTGIDPQLGALQNNGGPTLTMMPAAGSPVLDAGDPSFTAPPSTDQRGFTRVVSTLDMGSVEYDPPGDGGTLALTSATYSVDEDGGNVTITVTRTGGSSNAVSVDYATSAGTAVSPADFDSASGTLNWGDGDSASKSFQVAIVDDSVYEGSQTFGISLSVVTGGASLGTSSAIVTVADDEPFPSLSINNVSHFEGNGGTTKAYQFTVTLTPQSASVVTVNVSTASGTAASGADFSPLSANLSFAAGVTSQNVNVTVLGDNSGEWDETFTVVLASPSQATLGTPAGTGTIQNDDPPRPPTGFSATATAPSTVSLTWTAGIAAASYQVERQSTSGGPFVLIGSPGGTTFNDTTVSANTSYRYRVRSVNPFGLSAYSAVDLATTVVLTDSLLTGGVRVKAVHVTELRTMVNAVRAFSGLPAATFTDASLVGTKIKAIHLTELRTALDAAAAGAGLPSGGYTNPSPAGVVVKVVHFQELRNRVK